MPLRDHHRAAHRKYVPEQAALIRTARAMLDAQGNQCGSIYVFEAVSAEDGWAWPRRALRRPGVVRIRPRGGVGAGVQQSRGRRLAGVIAAPGTRRAEAEED